MTARRSFPTRTSDGETVDYTIVRVNNTFNIKKETPTELIRTFEYPSC